jgi:hypothetical protein
MQSRSKNRFVTLNPDETARFKVAVQPVRDRFMAEVNRGGSDGAKIIADAEALVKKYAK